MFSIYVFNNRFKFSQFFLLIFIKTMTDFHLTVLVADIEVVRKCLTPKLPLKLQIQSFPENDVNIEFSWVILIFYPTFRIYEIKD